MSRSLFAVVGGFFILYVPLVSTVLANCNRLIFEFHVALAFAFADQ